MREGNLDSLDLVRKQETIKTKIFSNNSFFFTSLLLIRIFIKNSKCENLFLNVDPTDRIIDIKAKIYEYEGIMLEQQLLILAGKQLDDENTLLDYSIDRDSTLHLAYL